MDNYFEFPEHLTRRISSPISSIAQEILKAQQDHQLLMLLGPYSAGEKITGALIRELCKEKGQLQAVPLQNCLVLAQELVGRFASSQGPLIKAPVLIIEEEKLKVPFISKADSWMLDQIHYGYTLLTTLVNRRSRARLTTIFLAPELPAWSATCLSFAAFYHHSSSLTSFLYQLES